jgi:hypothetical protein
MRALFLFVACILCRRVSIKQRDAFSFKDRVAKDQIYKLVYRVPENSKISILFLDPLGRTISATNDTSATLYSRMSHEGFVTIRVRNQGSMPVHFSYRCPDVDKEVYGTLGPIKDVDQVAELQNILESVIQRQREHIKKHEQHAHMVKASRSWATRLLILEVIFFVGVLYFLHRDMLKLFESKRSV